MTKAIDKDAIPMRHGRRIRVRRYACDMADTCEEGRGTMSDGPLLNDVTRAPSPRRIAMKTCVTWRSKPNGRRTSTCSAALDQIAGWQIARNKLPQWAACADIVYPAHISMEQCSSQFTAQYKAEIARRLLRSLLQSAGQTANDATMTDLTGRIRRRFLISRPRIRSRHVRGTPIAPVRTGPRTIWRRWASRKHRWCAATASNTYVRWSWRS